ncbi:coiled-coil protein [candidate division KSB1 bacterium]
MATKEEKKKVLKELQKHAKETAELRKELNSISDKKESLFQEKDKVSKKIRSFISQVRSSKTERDKLTREVKELKKIRSKLSEDIKKKIEEAKKLNKERDKVRQKHSIKADPSNLKREIEGMQMKIETEGMPFKKEQQLMEKIREKKKELDNARKVSGVFENLHKINDEINKLKKDADGAHKNIQLKAEKSQELHEKMIESSKGIDAIKKSEDEWNVKIEEVKKRFNEVNEALQKKLELMPKVKGRMDLAREDFKQTRKRKEEEKLIEKSKEVQEKIKKGEKLTTEDLMVMGSLGVDNPDDSEDFGEEEKEEAKKE